MSLFTETRTTTHLNREGHKRKNSPFIYILPALILSALLLSSCSFDGAGSDTTDGTSVPSGSSVVTVTGSLNPGGALPSEIAQFPQRTESSNIANSAFPSIPATGITYTVTAVNTASGSTESYTGEALTVDGSLTYRVGIPATENEKNFKIQVSAVYDSKEILSGESAEFPISSTSPIATKDITLSADQSSSGYGSINLEIDVSGTGITSCTAFFQGGLHGTFDKDSSDVITVSLGNVLNGCRPASFTFYDASSNILYSFTETINVFSNLTTNTWVKNGNEPWFVTTGTGASKTTTCRITSAMVEGFKLTEFYVDSSRSTTSGAANYTTESGTFLNPCKSLSKAIEKLTDANTDYTIKIKGTLLGSGCRIPASLKNDGSGTYNAKSLTLCGATGLDANGNPQDSLAVDNVTYDATVLVISSTVPVTIKNLLIKDGSIDDGHSSGIRLQSGENLTLSDGAVLKNNYAGYNGGAIDGTFKMKGSAYIPAGVDGVTGAGKNDVYLVDGKTIKIAGKLTPPAACTNGIVATITPASYTAGTQLIELDTGVTDTTLAEAAAHFAVTPENNAGTSKPWYIRANGKLYDSPYIGSKAPTEAKEVGDIVFNDGSAMPYSDFTSLASDDEKNALKLYAIALIFYKGTGLNSGDDITISRTLGVGLKHGNSLAWCTENAAAYNKYISTIYSWYNGYDGSYSFNQDKNGSDNFEQLGEFDGVNDTDTESKYPAFYFAKNYKDVIIGSESESRIAVDSEFATGWYLPSIAELFQIYKNGKGTSKLFDIDAASEVLGGDQFNTNFWSSTPYGSSSQKCAVYFKFNEGNVNYQEKDYNYFRACAIREF